MTVTLPAAVMRAMNGPGRRQMRRMRGSALTSTAACRSPGKSAVASRKALTPAFHERLTLQGVAPNVAILRQKRPTSRSDCGQERFVVGAGIEVIREHFDRRAGASQGSGDQPGAEVVIDQEDGLRRP